jgi:hypothetical protein
MTVRELGRYRAEVDWSATFESDGLPENEAAALLECALAADCRALKRHLEAS